MGEIFKRKAKIRRAAQRGKIISIPPDADLVAGDEVIQIYNGFVLVIPKGTKVDLDALEEAISTPVKKE